jgi:hypothetical protein
MIKKHVERIVNGYLERLVNTPASVLPQGYNPLEKIRAALYKWVYVPFNDTFVWLELKCLNTTQIESCGNFALLENMVKNPQKATRNELLAMRNAQEKLCMAVMNKPTYKEFEAMVDGNDNVIKERRAELEQLKKNIKEADISEEARTEMRDRIFGIELYLGYKLPENTFGFLTRWALGGDVSDIKKLSRDKLLEAAQLAKANNCRPTDYIKGVFTERDNKEIDLAATCIRFEWEEEQARNKKGRK